MADEKLVKYVRDNVAAGYDQATIRKALADGGYKKQAIEDAISESIAISSKANKPTIAPISSKRYAGFWIRFLAYVLDTLIIGIPAFAVITVVQVLVGKNALISTPLYLVAPAIWIYMEGTLGGTPGKLILGLRVVDSKNKYIGIPNAILRYIGKIISSITLGIGYLMIGWDPQKRGLHDKIANTYVIWNK